MKSRSITRLKDFKEDNLNNENDSNKNNDIKLLELTLNHSNSNNHTTNGSVIIANSQFKEISFKMIDDITQIPNTTMDDTMIKLWENDNSDNMSSNTLEEEKDKENDSISIDNNSISSTMTVESDDSSNNTPFNGDFESNDNILHQLIINSDNSDKFSIDNDNSNDDNDSDSQSQSQNTVTLPIDVLGTAALTNESVAGVGGVGDGSAGVGVDAAVDETAMVTTHTTDTHNDAIVVTDHQMHHHHTHHPAAFHHPMHHHHHHHHGGVEGEFFCAWLYFYLYVYMWSQSQ